MKLAIENEAETAVYGTYAHWHKFLMVGAFVLLSAVALSQIFYSSSLVGSPADTQNITEKIQNNSIDEVSTIEKPAVVNITPKADLSDLISQYTKGYDGVFGVSMIELSGQKRQANYNEKQQFITASTYKLFVAYSVLKRIDNSDMQWTDQVTDEKNLSTCFDDMIIYSDNDCAEALLLQIGQRTITDEVSAIGLVNTSFIGSDGIKTTSADLALLLSQVYNGQILSKPGSNRLIDDMKNNVYRDGIPTGISESIVADKVGFLDNLLHDAAIVYSPTGDYILVIMTDGSNWSSIADLAGKIEALRNF